MSPNPSKEQILKAIEVLIDSTKPETMVRGTRLVQTVDEIGFNIFQDYYVTYATQGYSVYKKRGCTDGSIIYLNLDKTYSTLNRAQSFVQKQDDSKDYVIMSNNVPYQISKVEETEDDV